MNAVLAGSNPVIVYIFKKSRIIALFQGQCWPNCCDSVDLITCDIMLVLCHGSQLKMNVLVAR